MQKGKILIICEKKKRNAIIETVAEKYESYVEYADICDAENSIRNTVRNKNIKLVIIDEGDYAEGVVDVLKYVRERTYCGIIICGKSETEERIVEFLQNGADLFIPAYVSETLFAEYVKKIISLTSQRNEKSAADISYDGLYINPGQRRVLIDGRQVGMPPKELELLHFLASHPNVVFTRDMLVEEIWGRENGASGRTIDVHIKRLRDKLGSERRQWKLGTVWGIGYRFDVFD